ncbi:hypothetical protein [uncultured Cocleimonas sp.]|uniref:hypothetical protein n=1 Tax=uncultured Cocleimonas sp. TaxID=1051587 RepID=UPI0026388D44|nr:hypothetical protein [uncultured Cocleimonas sp.]
MFIFTIVAKPKPDNNESKELGGAYVNAYINFKDEEGAEVIARYYIEDAGWYAEETDEVSWVFKGDLKKSEERYQYFKEAKASGSCLVFNTWPIDAEDVETKH